MRIHNFLRDYLIYLANFFMFLQPWEISLNSLSFPRAHDLCHYVFRNSPWNHYLFRDFTLNLLSFLRIHSKSIILFAMNLESFLQTMFEFIMILVNLFFCVFTIFFAISLKTRYNHFLIICIFCNYTFLFQFSINRVFLSGNFTWYFRESTINS